MAARVLNQYVSSCHSCRSYDVPTFNDVVCHDKAEAIDFLRRAATWVQERRMEKWKKPLAERLAFAAISKAADSAKEAFQLHVWVGIDATVSKIVARHVLVNFFNSPTIGSNLPPDVFSISNTEIETVV